MNELRNIVLLHKPSRLLPADFRTESDPSSLPWLDLTGLTFEQWEQATGHEEENSHGVFGKYSAPCFGYILNARESSRPTWGWNALLEQAARDGLPTPCVLVTDHEIQRLVEFVTAQGPPAFDASMHEKLKAASASAEEDVTDEDEELVEKCNERHWKSLTNFDQPP